MKSSARVVVIGGGVVGVSVLYHLTKAGWKDVLLIERGELTCGSTWHAAGGMHTVNGDPNVAKLQQYTINLYKELEALTGQSCGMHLTGGVMLAGTRARLDWLKMTKARGRYLGMELELVVAFEKLFLRGPAGSQLSLFEEQQECLEPLIDRREPEVVALDVAHEPALEVGDDWLRPILRVPLGPFSRDAPD